MPLLRALAAILALIMLGGCALIGKPSAEQAAETHGGRWFATAANPLAVDAAASVLERGGSAVDAAIAAQAVLTLVEPQSSGLAGGAFMLRYDPRTRLVETYDGRETAPASAHPDRFLDGLGQPLGGGAAVISGLSIGVPGVVRMLGLAHEEHGSIAFADLLAPALRLAEDGFKVSPRLNHMIGSARGLKEQEAARRYFFDGAGNPHPVGHVLKNPDYARTLRILIEKGPDGFYKGEIPAAIIATVNGDPRPGGMTLEDFKSYRAVKRDPVCGPYRGLTICSMGPPSPAGSPSCRSSECWSASTANAAARRFHYPERRGDLWRGFLRPEVARVVLPRTRADSGAAAGVQSEPEFPAGALSPGAPSAGEVASGSSQRRHHQPHPQGLRGAEAFLRRRLHVHPRAVEVGVFARRDALFFAAVRRHRRAAGRV